MEEVGLDEDDRFIFHDLIEVKSTGEVVLIGTEPGTKDRLACLRNVTGTKKFTSPVCCKRSTTDFVYSEIEGKYYLVMNCFECGIKLLDLKIMKIQTAFNWKRIVQMCEGQNDTLYVVRSNRIIQLDCSTTQFKWKPGWTLTVKVHSRLHYIRSTNILIVMEPLQHDFNIRFNVHAISCDSGQILWNVAHDDAMLVQDLPKYKGILGVYQSSAQSQSQIQIICPKTGLCAQQISLATIDYPIGYVRDILICNGRLFILGDSDTSCDATSKVFIYSV